MAITDPTNAFYAFNYLAIWATFAVSVPLLVVLFDGKLSKVKPKITVFTNITKIPPVIVGGGLTFSDKCVFYFVT